MGRTASRGDPRGYREAEGSERTPGPREGSWPIMRKLRACAIEVECEGGRRLWPRGLDWLRQGGDLQVFSVGKDVKR